MKSFYEKERENAALVLNRNGNHLFLPHYHQNMEILIVRKGGYVATVDDASYEVQSGCILVVDSYRIHSYDKRLGTEDVEDADDCILLVPYEQLGAFNKWRENGKIVCPLLNNPRLCDELLFLVDAYMGGDKSRETSEIAAQLMLSLLYGELTFTQTEKTGGEGALAQKILSYIEEHYRETCTRGEIARALGYTETHISRVFHKYMHRGISKYVNEKRLSYIEARRHAGDKRSTSELLFEAGFQSEPTYYRVKKCENEADSAKKI